MKQKNLRKILPGLCEKTVHLFAFTVILVLVKLLFQDFVQNI